MDETPMSHADHRHIAATDPLAVEVVRAIQQGDVARLQELLRAHRDLATARIVDAKGGERSLLHVATDWPGHFPHGADVVRCLVAAGSDVHARFAGGAHMETPLHWAASSDDLDVLDALLDAGADIEASGAVIGGGSPLTDATAFGQWNAARRLVERGAETTLFDEAALGLLDRLAERIDHVPGVDEESISDAFWGACHGDQRAAAEFLLDRGAALNHLPGWERLTPLDAAERSGAHELAAWLRARGALGAAAIPETS
jgi:uncharacterized protein